METCKHFNEEEDRKLILEVFKRVIGKYQGNVINSYIENRIKAELSEWLNDIFDIKHNALDKTIMELDINRLVLHEDYRNHVVKMIEEKC
jgi:DNA-binding HxlR family transcriptional regulator